MPDNYFDFSSLKTTRNRPYDADNLNYIYGRLKERGYDDKHIAVLLGTIAEESGGNPYAVSPDGKFQGLLQWAGDRYSINPFIEENPKRELDRQIDYIARTIDNLDDSKSWTHGGKGSGYNRAADAHEAYVSSDSLDAINHAFNRGYVRPTGGDDSVANRYKVAEQVYSIITSGLPESVKAVNNSDAPFARDLRAGAKQRGYIKNADGSVSSYKMASGSDDIGPYVFPVIQRDENGVLRDYSMPPYKAGYAQQRAEETGNLVRVPTDEDAQWFAEDNYKRFYDVTPVNTYPLGGSIILPNVNRQMLKETGLSLLPKDVSKGLSAIASLTWGRIAGAPLLDYYRYGTQEDSNPEQGFLMSDSNQQKYMEEIGYHKVDDGNYGMVNKAAKRLGKITGRTIPIYQLGDDDISPDDVELVTTDSKQINDMLGNRMFDDDFQKRLPRGANAYPIALYKQKDGDKYFIKAWDLNDYGMHGERTGGVTYGGWQQLLAEIYDYMGNPFVQRTGLVSVPEDYSQHE